MEATLLLSTHDGEMLTTIQRAIRNHESLSTELQCQWLHLLSHVGHLLLSRKKCGLTSRSHRVGQLFVSNTYPSIEFMPLKKGLRYNYQISFPMLIKKGTQYHVSLCLS